MAEATNAQMQQDDTLVFNSFCDLLEKFFAGTFANVGEANSAAAQWAVLQDACVRPLLQP